MSRRQTILVVSLIAWLGLCRAAWPAAPDAAQRDFDEGNRLYEQGRYERALASYERASAARSDWKVHFNAGNCLYKLGRFLDAKIQFLKARRLHPDEQAIDGNLALVNRRFRDAIPPARPDFPARLAAWLDSRLAPDVIDLLLLLAAGLGNYFLFRLLTRGRRRRWLYALAAALLLLALLSGWQAQRLAARRAATTAVVLAEKAELRSGPGSDQTVFFEVHAGLEVTVGERRGDWLYVSASDQVAGWIERSSLRSI